MEISEANFPTSRLISPTPTEVQIGQDRLVAKPKGSRVLDELDCDEIFITEISIGSLPHLCTRS